MDSFSNFFDFQQRFSDNDSCRAYLEHLRWDGTITCPFCKSEKHYSFKGGKTYKCADCLKKYNVLIGSIFENTKIALNKWFWAIYVATSHKKGISSAQLARDIDVQQRTAWFMLHRIRESLRAKGGLFTKATEIDETWIGGKEKNKHASKKKPHSSGPNPEVKTPILGILERGGDVYAESVLHVGQQAVYPVIRNKVKLGTTVITDDAASYDQLKYYYRHLSVNHSEKEYVSTTEFVKGKAAHTNTIEGFFSTVKRSIVGIYHHVSPRHLNRYCGEWTFRYNTRKMNETERFNNSVQRMIGKRLTYTWLTAKHNWE